MSEQKKFVVITTNGPDNPEKATIAFAVANASLAMGSQVMIVAQSDGVLNFSQTAVKGVQAQNFPVLENLVKQYFELGGRAMVCTPCMASRSMKESDLFEGTIQGAAGTIVAELLSSDIQISY